MKTGINAYDMARGTLRFFVTMILVSVMTFASALPIMLRFTVAGAEGATIITRDESAAVKLMPLKMQIPDDPDIETSGDVKK